MSNNDDTLLTCELNTEKACELFRKCEEEGLTFSEKLQQMIQNFLAKGDYHLNVLPTPISPKFFSQR